MAAHELDGRFAVFCDDDTFAVLSGDDELGKDVLFASRKANSMIKVLLGTQIVSTTMRQRASPSKDYSVTTLRSRC